ncbi:MAG: helix-turn-helix transcriptional regulator [Peptococcaceae bacterium]|nr:helix-turn-helix transcriptional regulator [Peptococcaceae bacterium]
MSVPTPDILRKLREDHELKQDSLAKQLGVVQQTYSNYEKGHSAIPLEYLVKLASFYQVSTDYLLGLTPLEKPAADMGKPYAQGKTLGEVTSALVTLSPQRRRQLLDYLSYLVARQKEDVQKQKIKE